MLQCLNMKFQDILLHHIASLYAKKKISKEKKITRINSKVKK
mgnify:CR=1 FL=1